MRLRGKHPGTYLLLGLFFALLFPLSTGVVEAKKEKAGKCEGTKKQRKQKMEKRDLTDAQLAEMISQYKQTLTAERELMKETVVRRLVRKYEEHQASGGPFNYEILVISGGGAKGAFGAGFFEGWGEIESGPYARPEFDMITGVSTGALSTLTSTSQIFALGLIRDMVHDAKSDRGMDAELHLVSIPDDAPKKTTKEMFYQEYMRKLEDLGRKMGADPSSWSDEIPSAYRVEGDWLDSD